MGGGGLKRKVLGACIGGGAVNRNNMVYNMRLANVISLIAGPS